MGTATAPRSKQAQKAANPFGGIRPPEEDAVISANTARFQGVGEEQRLRGEASVGPGSVGDNRGRRRSRGRVGSVAKSAKSERSEVTRHRR